MQPGRIKKAAGFQRERERFALVVICAWTSKREREDVLLNRTLSLSRLVAEARRKIAEQGHV